MNMKNCTLNSTRSLCRQESLASLKEVLVPIRIELEAEGLKIKDQFTWNLNEQAITPDKFAEYVCHDLSINPASYIPMIASSIKSQIADFKAFYQLNDFPIAQDSRVIIKLDIFTGKVHLRDRFEWDLSSSSASPEDFAKTLVQDLGLGSEFVTMIAHSIREQIYKIRKDGEYDQTFAIERPFRAEEEARSWAPCVDCGEIETDDVDESGLDRHTR